MRRSTRSSSTTTPTTASKHPASSSTGGKYGKSRLGTSVSRCGRGLSTPKGSLHASGLPGDGCRAGSATRTPFQKEGGQTGCGKGLRKSGMVGRQPKIKNPARQWGRLGNSGPFYFVARVPRAAGIELFFAELCRIVTLSPRSVPERLKRSATLT